MIPLSRHGWRELLIGSIVLAAMSVVLGYWWFPLSIITLPVLIWLFAFFRDPHRIIPTEQHVMVSPADGKVSDITQIEHDEYIGGPAVRIGIFLSIFNVHVNRAPCDAKVSRVEYKKGKFINAMHHNAASTKNESNTLVLVDRHTDKPVAVVRQLVGLIARRIICTKIKGDLVARGERFGMIKFGSRTELTIPMALEPTVKVQIGQNVKAGVDIMATCAQPIHTEIPEPAGEELEPTLPRETPS